MNTVTSKQFLYPFNANDTMVITEGNVRRFQYEDWDNTKHKLLILIPEVFTPVCETELGAMNHWYEEFDKLNCELIAVTSDQAHAMLDWQEQEPALQNPKYKTFASYLIPTRLSLMDNGRPKRASVFITNGEITKQEHFLKVGRSFAELHRMLYGFTTDSYCAEGWSDPSDGFLNPPEKA